jgi:hypothetical protein
MFHRYDLSKYFRVQVCEPTERQVRVGMQSPWCRNRSRTPLRRTPRPMWHLPTLTPPPTPPPMWHRPTPTPTPRLATPPPRPMWHRPTPILPWPLPKQMPQRRAPLACGTRDVVDTKRGKFGDVVAEGDTVTVISSMGIASEEQVPHSDLVVNERGAWRKALQALANKRPPLRHSIPRSRIRARAARLAQPGVLEDTYTVPCCGKVVVDECLVRRHRELLRLTCSCSCSPWQFIGEQMH